MNQITGLLSKILVIDDDEETREVLCRFLESSGYDVLVAADGTEALNLVDNFKPRLVITNIIVSDLDGLSTIMELKTTYPQIRIITISGGGQVLSAEQYKGMASTLGADRVICKPLDLDQLLKAVTELLAH